MVMTPDYTHANGQRWCHQLAGWRVGRRATYRELDIDFLALVLEVFKLGEGIVQPDVCYSVVLVDV
jgi:hypothetical protein